MSKYGFAFWQSQQDALHELYYEKKLSTFEIGKIYGVWSSTIEINMRRLGFELRHIGDDSRPNAKYHVDSEFFDTINTEEKAYVLGFILADGHISKRNALMFGLKSDDIDVLYKIRAAMKSTHNIKISEKKNAALLSICCAHIGKRLNELGVYHDKTFSLKIQNIVSQIPQELECHFVRGLFDGDGGLGIYHYPYFKKHSFS